MNILFLSLSTFEDIKQRGIYSDLIRKFLANKHSVTVVYPIQKRENKDTEFTNRGNIKFLAVRTGNITKCKNVFEKGFSTLRIQKQYIKAINTHCSDITYDLVLYATPPITFSKIVHKIKKRDGAKSYLMLKDIFPQNALDIGILSNRGIWKILHGWLRIKEKKLYRVSDYIGCMSPRNAEYILEHNGISIKSKIEVCPNSIEPIPKTIINTKRQKVNKQVNFLYGGNLGKPQGIPFLIECLKDNINKEDRRFIICGTGTESKLLEEFLQETKPSNITFISGLPVDAYEQLVFDCDVGMVFLDYRFTIPNFPSRILSYMEKSKPILACTDSNTDLGEIITKGNFGWWCESNSVEGFTKLIDTICFQSQPQLHEYGENARNYLDTHYTVKNTYNTIMKHFPKDIDHV